MKVRTAVLYAGLGSLLILLLSLQGHASQDVSKAVEVMRNTGSSGPGSSGDREAALSEARKALTDAGPAGVEAIKAELKKMEGAKERGDRFKLEAGALLWSIGKISEAETIASIWAGDVDLGAGYRYVFFPAFQAATTRDPRVIPMLTAALRQETGSVDLPDGSLKVAWPVSSLFIWGAFGSHGVEPLERILVESKNDATRASALVILESAQDLNALTTIRILAREGTGLAHLAAIRALGTFGHPRDFDFLQKGLSAGRSDEIASFAHALGEFGDLRAADQLVPLLGSDDMTVVSEAATGLSRLLTVNGVEALGKCSRTTGDEKRRAVCRAVATGLFEALDLSYEAYSHKPPARKVYLVGTLRSLREAKYLLRADDRTFLHDDLLKAAAEWKADKTLRQGAYGWVEERHILAAAGPADIPLLLDVTAACYSRLSGNALYEVRTLREVIKRVGRSRYRYPVGVSEHTGVSLRS